MMMMTTTTRRLAGLVAALVLVAANQGLLVLADKKLTPEQQDLLLETFLASNGTVPANATDYSAYYSEIAASRNVSVGRWMEIRSAMVTEKESRDAPTLTVRKEVREMTCAEWEAYANAVKKLYQTEHWAKYNRVHEDERQLIWDLSHSDARQRLFTFLPWHRLWLRGIERELQKIDPKAAIPYWNWALDSTDPLKSAVLSDQYFGGNGDPDKNNCVTDGAFRAINFRETSTGSNATEEDFCIKRFLPEKPGGFLNLVHIKDVLVGCEDFDSFNLCVENGPGLYGYMHMFMGGDEAQNSNDPLFLSMYAFADMLWWKWQRMHDGMNNPALSFRGNKEEILLPFEEHVEDVFSVEEMGYTYSSPMELPQDARAGERPCYVEEKGGDIDLVLLGHQIFDKLPENITELVKIPRKTPLLSVDTWRQWVQLKLNHSQVPTAVELEGDLKMWSHFASWPSMNETDWRTQEDYGLGIPVSMVIPEFFLQAELFGQRNTSSNYCDGLTMENKEDPRCVMRRPKTKWYLNTFHTCIEKELLKKRKEKEVADDFTFRYLSYEENQAEIDDVVLKEAEQILTQILFDAVDPVLQFEENRFLVLDEETDEVVEIEVNGEAGEEMAEAAEGGLDGKQDEEPFLLTMPDRTEAVAAEDTPLDQGEKLFNLADSFEEAINDPALERDTTKEALEKVNKIFDRANFILASGRSGWRYGQNLNNFMEAVSRSPLGRFALGRR